MEVVDDLNYDEMEKVDASNTIEKRIVNAFTNHIDMNLDNHDHHEV